MSFKFTKSNLNFDVYTVASKPTAPGANNDIAIITPVPMPNWTMSPDKPSGMPRSDGDVWIRYSVSGDTFNVLKNNTMMIATISAWQYVDGEWVDVEAVSCQNGEWVDLWDGTLLNGSDLCEAITGGWVLECDRSGFTMVPMEKTVNGLNFTCDSSSARLGRLRTKNKINLKGKNTLYLTATVSAPFHVMRVFVTDEYEGMADGFLAYKDFTTTGTVTLPLDGCNDGEHYVGLCVYNSYNNRKSSNITMTEVRVK